MLVWVLALVWVSVWVLVLVLVWVLVQLSAGEGVGVCTGVSEGALLVDVVLSNVVQGGTGQAGGGFGFLSCQWVAIWMVASLVASDSLFGDDVVLREGCARHPGYPHVLCNVRKVQAQVHTTNGHPCASFWGP